MSEPIPLSELERVTQLLQKRNEEIAHMRERAKKFVGDMRAENNALKQQLQQAQQAQAEQSTAPPPGVVANDKVARLEEEKMALTNQVNRLTEEQATSTHSVNRLTAEKAALVRDVQEAKTEWSVERSKTTQLEHDMTSLFTAQQQSTEVMSEVQGQSRKRQVQLDTAAEKIQEQEQLVARLRLEVDTQNEIAEEARYELERVTNQTSLQVGASSQVLKDLRTHVTAVEKERDALVAGLNQVRVAAKDGHLKLEADVREASAKVHDLTQVLSAERSTFKERRDLAKIKFTELMERAQTAEAQVEQRTHEHAAADAATADIRVMSQKLEIDLKSAQNERDVLLHEKQTKNNSHDDDRSRLVETLEKTERELRDQRAKRMVAKNEILSMVRQMDGQRDVMTELFGQLQKIVTRVGTYVISCRGAESKCNDTLSVLDVEMEVELSVGEGGGVHVSSAEEKRGNGGNGGSGGSGSGGTKRKKKRRKSGGGSRRTPRNPTDLMDVLEDELDVLGGIVDEVSTKVALLTKHCRHGGGQGGKETTGGSGVDESSCVGYVKRMFGVAGKDERRTVQRTSLNGKRRKKVQKYGKLEEVDD